MTTKAKIFWTTVVLVIISLSFYFWKGSMRSEGAKVSETSSGKIGKMPSVDLYNNQHPYLLVAHKLNNEKKYDSAIFLYTAAAERFYKEKQWENYVWVNGYIARLYLYVAGKDFHQALPYLERSAGTGRVYLKPENAYLAPTWYYYGLYYGKMNADTTAVARFQRALDVLGANGLDTSLYAADNLEGIADVYFNQSFKNLEAEKYYLKAVGIRESLPHPAADSDISISYYNLVTLYDYIGDYDKAQYYCQKALQQLSFIRNYRNYWEELLYGVAGHLYTKLRQDVKAIATLQDVIRLNTDRHSDKVLLTFYLSSLGDIYAAMGAYDSAVLYYNKSLNVTHAVSIYESSELQRAATSYDLGMTLLKSGRTAQALPPLAYNLRFRLTNQPGNTKEVVTACNGVAQAFYQLGRPDSALRYLQLGLGAYGIRQPADSFWVVPRTAQLQSAFWSYQIIGQKAAVLKMFYDRQPTDRELLVAALDHYVLADSLARGFRNVYESEGSKLTFNSNTNDLYEGAIECADELLQAGQDPKYQEVVLRLIESRKSSLLFQSLREDAFFRRLPSSVEERSEYRRAFEEVSFLRSQIDNKNEGLGARLIESQAKFLSIQNKLTKKYSRGTAAQTTANELGLPDMVRYGEVQQTMVIDYFWGKSALYLVGIFNGRSTVVCEPIDAALLKNLDNLRRQLSKGFVLATEDADFAIYQCCAYYLFRHLLEPVFTRLNAGVGGNSPTINLVISPDGPLWTVPFEAFDVDSVRRMGLDYGRLNYLLRHCNISYAYSGRFLVKTAGADSSVANSRLLAFSTSQSQLPGAMAEIDSISRYYKGTVYREDLATKAVFKQDAPQFDILHLAVHGTADSTNLFDSRLFFKKAAKDSDEGVLHAYELYGLPLKARLAVLSACESGTGRFSNGEGVYSMSRAFTLAGCQSIVSSLWRVDDQATTAVMSGFYRDLSKSHTLSQSLTGSKLAYISSADRRNAHPAKWSAFVIFGDSNSTLPPGERDGGGKIYWLLAATVVLLIAGMLIGRGFRKKGFW